MKKKLELTFFMDNPEEGDSGNNPDDGGKSGGPDEL